MQILTASRWSLVHTNDLEGIIEATAATPVLRLVHDVTLRITLDENAQTRVDMTSHSRKGGWDLGRNARRIHRFLRQLDRRLEAKPEHILSDQVGVS